MSKNIIICGVGGQGIVLSAKVLSQVAISSGQKVLSAETIGMAQRGGSVVSHVRIGQNIFSPLITKKQADIIISFEIAEALRNIEFLKDDGIVIVNQKQIQSVNSSLSGKTFNKDTLLEKLKQKTNNVICVDTEKICNNLGSFKVANIVLLGAACKTGFFNIQEVDKAIKTLVKPEFYELNKKALFYEQ